MTGLTAVLLCGGKGERLKPFSETLPKPLVPLSGRPLVRYLMDYLYAGGVREFVLCVGYMADQMRAFAAQQTDRDWKITCVDSGDAPMTDRVRAARAHVPGRALICYGDTLAHVDLRELVALHEQNKSLATVTVHPFQSPFGLVEFSDAGRVKEFVEKPLLPYYINIGFVVCEAEALAAVPPGTDMVSFLKSYIPSGQLSAYVHGGKHLTVNTPKEHKEAEEQIVEFFTAQ